MVGRASHAVGLVGFCRAVQCRLLPGKQSTVELVWWRSHARVRACRAGLRVSGALLARRAVPPLSAALEVKGWAPRRAPPDILTCSLLHSAAPAGQRGPLAVGDRPLPPLLLSDQAPAALDPRATTMQTVASARAVAVNASYGSGTSMSRDGAPARRPSFAPPRRQPQQRSGFPEQPEAAATARWGRPPNPPTAGAVGAGAQPLRALLRPHLAPPCPPLQPRFPGAQPLPHPQLPGPA